MTALYDCEQCDWENDARRYGLAEAGATWAYHVADAHPKGDFDCCKRPVQVPASNSDARKRLAAAPLAGYFVAEDWAGDFAIWRGHPDDAAPKAAIYKFEFGGDDILWDALVAAIKAAS